MAKVTGSVDDRGRPVVRIEGKTDSFLLVVDTGFNGDLMISRSAADTLGMTLSDDETSVELGDGTTASVFEGRTTIPWLGAERRVRVLVSDTWQPSNEVPSGLLGTELMTPHLLFVDFGARTVEIETQD